MLGPLGRRYALTLEERADGSYRPSLDTDHVEDAPDNLHLTLVDLVAVPVRVELEAVARGMCGEHLAFPRLALPSAAAPLRDLRPLVLAELVEYAVRELALGAIVSPIVEGADLRTVLLELSPEQVMVGGLPGYTVPILRQHHRHTTSRYQVSHAVHPGPLQTRAALSGVLYLLEYLVAFSGGVLTQGFDLLGQGVARAGLLVCGDAGVEDGPLGAVAVRVRHGQSPTSSVGSTSRALASLRSVLM